MAVALGLLAKNLIKVGPQGAPHLPRRPQTGPCIHRAGVGKRGFWGTASVEGTQDTPHPAPHRSSSLAVFVGTFSSSHDTLHLCSSQRGLSSLKKLRGFQICSFCSTFSPHS